MSARGRTAQRGYRLIKATEDIVKERCANAKIFDHRRCANELRELLMRLGCDTRHIWGTYVFAVSNCEVSESFQLLEPIDFHSLTGFSTDDIRYVFYGGDSTDLADLLKYGPIQLPSNILKFNVFYLSDEESLWSTFLTAMGAKSINDNTSEIKLGNWVTLRLQRIPVSTSISLQTNLSWDRIPAVFLTDKDLKPLKWFKYRAKNERGCFSRLQIVKGQTLQRFNKYTQVNIISALVTKSGGVPYILKVLPTNRLSVKLGNLLNSGVFIGIALGKAMRGYSVAAASIITVNLTVKLCYHTPLEGSSMEMPPEKMDNFVNAIAKDIHQLVDKQSVGLIAMLRTRGFRQEEGEKILNSIEKRLFEGAKRLGRRPMIVAIGVSKYLPLSADGDGDLVWVVKEGEKHGILLYKFHGFRNAVRIEYRAGGDLEKVEVEDLCDVVIYVPSDETAIIQECHQILGHILIENLERKWREG